MGRAAAFIFALIAFAHASEPLTDGGASVTLPADKATLLVVHPHIHFDRKLSAKNGIDRVVSAFNADKLPVVALKVCDLSRFYYDFGPRPEDVALYAADQTPTAVICSGDGAHSLPVASREIYVAGGFDNRCLLRALLDAVGSAIAANPNVPIDVYLVRDAIYSSGLDDLGGDIPMPTHHLDSLSPGDLERTVAKMFSRNSWVYSGKKWPARTPNFRLARPEGSSGVREQVGKGGDVMVRTISSANIGKNARRPLALKNIPAILKSLPNW
ncbi:MAG: hypothetical protein AAB036_05185 [Elusimicrobiota bacterium]